MATQLQVIKLFQLWECGNLMVCSMYPENHTSRDRLMQQGMMHDFFLQNSRFQKRDVSFDDTFQKQNGKNKTNVTDKHDVCPHHHCHSVCFVIVPAKADCNVMCYENLIPLVPCPELSVLNFYYLSYRQRQTSTEQTVNSSNRLRKGAPSWLAQSLW